MATVQIILQTNMRVLSLEDGDMLAAPRKNKEERTKADDALKSSLKSSWALPQPSISWALGH